MYNATIHPKNRLIPNPNSLEVTDPPLSFPVRQFTGKLYSKGKTEEGLIRKRSLNIERNSRRTG
jgi:hypothetical protein